MKDLFIPFNLAVIGKDKGFDEKCLGYYNQNERVFLFEIMMGDKFTIEQNPNYEGGILAPLYQQIIYWFEKSEIFPDAKLDISDGTFKWYGKVEVIIDYELKTVFTSRPYPTKQKALDEAIKEAFNLHV